MEPRPEWKHNIPYKEAAWYNDNHVVKIEHKWEYTREDTSREWLVLTTTNGTIKLVDNLPREVKFEKYHAGLLRLDNWISDSVYKIQQWESAHKAKIDAYHQLKKELGL